VHGLIHIELERFVRARLGDEAWARACEDAGVAGDSYKATTQYPDAELVALVVALAKAAEVGPQALLELFGEALVGPLVETYGALLDPEWRTIELIANTEELIHTVLRANDAEARPPMLRATMRGEDELLVIYGSERQMCGVAKGIIRGVAAHYGELIVLTEESCMLTGDRTCNLAVKRVERRSQRGATPP
jgi:hypothetical protein